MTYQKRDNVPCDAGEAVVELDSGDLVAVVCTACRDHLSNDLVYCAKARWIDGEGVTLADSAGRPVSTSHTYRAMASDVEMFGPAGLPKECLLLVLGEPLTPREGYPEITLIPWGADVVSQCSIRNAIASAKVVAPSASDVL